MRGMTVSRKYEGRRALVTGSASGIGKALVQHLVNHGAKVICCDINATAGQAAVDEANKSSATSVAWFVKLDVSSWEQTVATFKRAEEIFGGKLDHVFANAGTSSGDQLFGDEEGKPSTRSIDINFVGVMYTVQAAILHFRKHKGGGSIIATASLSGLYSFRADPLYAASKHAVVGLVRSAALRTRREGIYINAIAPASTESGMMPAAILKQMTAVGLVTSKESIINAFEQFLTPGCKLSGQIAMALNEKLYMMDQPVPPDWKPRGRL